MDPSELYEYEGRYYETPTLTRDETMNFVDSLRGTVQQNNANIANSTQALGTNVPSNLGGLTGAEGYFAQRYQTTPIQQQAATLKAAAQADALNKLMTNYKNQAANRYQQAYRSYAKRNGGGGGSGGGGGGGTTPNGGVKYIPTDQEPLYTDPNDVVMQEPSSRAADVVSGSALYGGNPGNRQYGSSTTPYYYVLDGDTTSFTLKKNFWGYGIETPTMDYTEEGSKNFIRDIIRRGGRIYNQYDKDITDMATYIMGL